LELSCTQLKSPEDSPSLIVVVKCIASAPDRISSISLEFQVEGNEILDISPQEVLGRETHTELSTKGNKKVGINAGVAVEGFSLGASFEKDKGVEKSATQVTQMSIKGVRIGRTEARWVLSEDPSDAGRAGLPTETELRMKVRFKPRKVMCSYQITAAKGDDARLAFDEKAEVNL
ncbi:hypothetical protein FA15DRAFT_711364, partial [Coprinopsis marcescibilis]